MSEQMIGQPEGRKLPVMYRISFDCFVGTCDALSPLPNGRIWYNTRGFDGEIFEGNDNDGYPVGISAQFFCNNGYSRHGSWRRTCGNSLKWDESTPQCIKSNKIHL